MKSRMQTCVVGSYPVAVDTLSMMHQYFDQKPIPSWHHYIKEAVTDMVAAGVDMVSDGQTRDPFIQLFTRRLQGCRVRSRTEIVDKVEYMGPITVDDQQYVKHHLLPKDRLLKGVITGPYTLMKSCVDLYYHDEHQLAFDFASALHQEAQQVQKHVDLISIDEPFFSNDMPEYAADLIKKVVQGVHRPTTLHVCGDVTAIIPNLLEIPVDILSHEFKRSPHLLEDFSQFSFLNIFLTPPLIE